MNTRKTENNGFEKSLERLEEIVDRMESGELSLDDIINHFEEGSKLVKQCSTRLAEVEKKIEKLVSLQDAETTEPFDEESEAS
ncbi:MAG: exodeoxyribonuclease VII small subunit [Luteolibacter sp.]